MPNLKGALITSVTDKESRAAKAGLQNNDVVIEFNGLPVEGHSDLIAKIASSEPGKEVKLTYLREINNKLERQMATVILGERPPSGRSSLPGDDTPKKLGQPQVIPATGGKKIGLTVEEFTAELAKTNNLEGQKGVIVKEVDPASFIADVKGSNGRGMVNEGDVIQRINRLPVSDLKTFNEIVGKLKVGDAVVFHIVSYSRASKSPQTRIVTFTVQ
jgi:serine protease Do